MATSIFLARLIGPFTLVLGLAMLINAATMRSMVDEFLKSQALIFLSGAITLPAGIAIVLVHNRWTASWPVLITILGWLMVIAGLIRLLLPQRASWIGRRFSSVHPTTLQIIGAVYAAVGAILCFYGYFH